MLNAKLTSLIQKHSALCVGIDPTAGVMQKWGLPDTLEGLKKFAGTMADVCAGRIAIIKPQVAYFERFGPDGFTVLRDMCRIIRAKDTLILYDAKRGDIGSTNEGYAQAWLGNDSPFQGDFLTVNPYLGFGSLQPYLDHTHKTGTGLFVLVRTSNPESATLQDAVCANGRTVALSLCDDITSYNSKTYGDDIGAIGAVIGATLKNINTITDALPHSLLLAPGIGAQGATFEDVKNVFGMHTPRVVPNLARSILMAGPDPDKIAAAITDAQNQTRALLT